MGCYVCDIILGCYASLFYHLLSFYFHVGVILFPVLCFMVAVFSVFEFYGLIFIVFVFR